MEKEIKQRVLVFTDKRAFFSNGHRRPSGDYNQDKVMEELGKIFPSSHYDVGVIDYERQRLFTDINEIWKNERTPILIGCGSGANYIESVKNYKRKYLISPTIYPSDLTIDEYDRENTVCLFGGDKKSLQKSEVYAEFYGATHDEISKGQLELLEGIRYIGVWEAMMMVSRIENDTKE